MRAAWTWAAHAGRDDLFARLGRQFDRSYRAAGYDDELRALTEVGLARLPEGGRGWARQLIILCYGRFFDSQHRYEVTYALLDRALNAFERHGDERGAAQSLNYKGGFALRLGRPDESVALWEQARTRYARLGDRAREGMMLVNQAALTLDPIEKDRLYDEVHQLYEHTWAWREKQLLFGHHANHLIETYGHYDRVRASMQQALSKVGRSDVFDRCRTLLVSSKAALYQGDLVSARESAHEVLEVLESFTSQEALRVRQTAQIQLAKVALAAGEARGAAEIAERTDDTALRARVALRRGEQERARQQLFAGELDRLWRTEEDVRNRAWKRINVLLLAAEIAAIGARPDEAWKHLREALTLTCDLVFVPSALETFVVAAPLLPGDEAEELLTLAATHPAATYNTRQRARHRMAVDPTGMEPSTLTDEEILQRARSLLET